MNDSLVVNLNDLFPVYVFEMLLERVDCNWNVRARNRGRQKGLWSSHSETNFFSEEFYSALTLLFVPFTENTGFYLLLVALSFSKLSKISDIFIGLVCAIN